MRRTLLLALLLAFAATAPNARAQVLPFAPPLVPAEAMAKRDSADFLRKAIGLGRAKPAEESTINRLRSEAARIEADAYGLPVLSLIGSGGLRGLNTGDTSRATSTANGAIGLRLVTSFAQYTALINVVAEEPTVTSGFAGAILNAGSGSRGVQLDYQRGWKASRFTGANTPPRRWGVQVTGSLSNAKWQAGEEVRDVNALAASFRATYDIFRASDTTGGKRLDYGLRFDVGPTMRSVSVDGAAPASFREKVLGGRRAAYAGLEGGLMLLVGNFLASARITWFPEFTQERVPGLTGVQISTSIALQADLTQLTVRFR